MRFDCTCWRICSCDDSTTLINSNCYSFCYRLAAVERESFEIPFWGEERGRVRGRVLHQLKAHSRPPNSTFCSNCRRLAGITMSNYDPPLIRPPFWGLEDRKWYQSKCRPHIPIRLRDTPRPIYQRLATMHNAADDRQTGGQSDRNRPPMQ